MSFVRPLCLCVPVVDVRHHACAAVAAVARSGPRRRGGSASAGDMAGDAHAEVEDRHRRRVRDADCRQRARLHPRPKRRAGNHHGLRRRDRQAHLERRSCRALQGEPGRRVPRARPQVLARTRQRTPLHVRHQRHPVVPGRRQRKGHLAQTAFSRAAQLRRRDVADCRRRPAGRLHRRPRARRADGL